jgi:hypothetical protein
MWLWITIPISLLAGLLAPFSDRLNNTSLWAGKALTPPDLAAVNPRGLQEPLTAGWPSTLIFVSSSLPIVAAIVGFVHAWWAGFVVYLSTVVIIVIAKRTPLASHRVERYLMILLSHASQRSANYALRGDTKRAEAARDLASQMTDLLRLYVNSGVLAPASRQVRNAPFGNPGWLLSSSLLTSCSKGA